MRHAWWSVRRRCRVALLVVAAHALAVVILFASVDGSTPGSWEMAEKDRARVDAVFAGPYSEYLRETWSGDLAALLAVIGILLAVGGVAAERRQGTLDLTLSLPVARPVWLLARAGMVLGLLVAMALLSALLVAAGALVLGEALPVGLLAASVVAGGLAPAYLVAAAVLATVWTRDAIVAALAALALLYLTAGGGVTGRWAPGVLLDPGALGPGAPWAPLLTAAALTAAFLILAVRRFESSDA